MIEIYKHQLETIEKVVYVSGVPSTTVIPTFSYEIWAGPTAVDNGSISGGNVEVIQDQPGDAVVYKITVPPQATTRQLTLIWDYEVGGIPVQEKEVLQVVTPYAQYHEIVKAYPLLKDQRSYWEIKEMERRVRAIIDTFCNQTFEKREDRVLRVRGHGGDSLQLPDRLLRLESVTANYSDVTGMVKLNEGGDWFLHYNGPYGFYRERNIKADIGPGMGLSRISPFFRNDVIYTLRGDFGWEAVPNMVNQAALLLVWNYFQPEAEWRRKNVNVLTAADWRIEMASHPSQTTGNVDADLMLKNYIAPGVVIL